MRERSSSSGEDGGLPDLRQSKRRWVECVDGAASSKVRAAARTGAIHGRGRMHRAVSYDDAAQAERAAGLSMRAARARPRTQRGAGPRRTTPRHTFGGSFVYIVMRTLPPTKSNGLGGLHPGVRLATAADAFKVLAPMAQGLEREHFWRVDLDAHDRLLGWELVTIGTVDEATVYPREVFRGALKGALTARILVAHNHPAQDASPSDADRKLTRRLVLCGLLLGIPLADHLILTDREFFSFKNRRLL